MLNKNVSKEQLEEVNKGTLMEHLEIEVTELGDDFVNGRMPVNEKTKQPHGVLHGGASVALIESLGSIGSSLIVDLTKEYPVGLEVNANHVGSVNSGFVKAHAKVVHLGKRTHVWQVEIRSEDSDKLICTGRLTVMIVQKK